MPNIKSLIDALPVYAHNPEAGSNLLSIRDSQGNIIALTESRDYAFILEDLLNRYNGSLLSDVPTVCSICKKPQKATFLEGPDGLLTIKLPCIVGSLTKEPCPGVNYVPVPIKK